MIALSLVAVLSAQVPQTINFQGALKDANGEPVNDSKYMEFRIYDVLTGGSTIWTEQHPTVTITDGIFSVELGLTTPIPPSMLVAPELYITYFLGGETAEMSPRRRILSVPYAIMSDEANLALIADNADSLGGVPVSGFVLQDSLGNATINGTMTANAFIGDGSGLTGITGVYDSTYIHATGPDTMTANSGLPTLTVSNSGAGDGILIDSAGDDGININNVTTDGVHIYSTGDDGLQIESSGNFGVRIDSTGNDGVYVYNAGNPTSHTSIALNNGFEVAGAEDYGVYVGYAGSKGIVVNQVGNPSSQTFSTSKPGLEVVGTEGEGVFVGQADDDGVYVYRAGNPATQSWISTKSGFEVAGAEGDGLYVGYSGVDGVHVKEATDNGIQIEKSGNFGVRIDSTGNDGIYIRKAGNPSSINSNFYKNGLEIAGAENDGVHIGFAGSSGVVIDSVLFKGVHIEYVGNPSTRFWSGEDDGFSVAGSEGNGVFVGQADEDGVVVVKAGNPTDYYTNWENCGVEVLGAESDGVFVGYSNENGGYVNFADSCGVWANTTDSSGEWGIDTPDKIRGSNITTRSMSTYGKNEGTAFLEPGDIVSLTGYEENILGDSDIPIIKVTKTDRNNTEAVIGVVEYKVAINKNIKHIGKKETNERESISRKSFRFEDGQAHNGDYVSIFILGPADVKVDSRENIKTGESLTAGNGFARKVRKREFEGITVAENVGILGKALEDSNGKDKIKVYVNCK